ncbi:MAG: hypothetical protein ACYSO4_11025 [Planctomycetota bacterium]|jgi:type II secretory pathway pseudopilin PulG
MIVVAILGILAAIVIPEFSGHIQKAKESAAKDNLRLLRNAIERYAQDHNGVPPGYVNGIIGQRGTIFIQFIYCTDSNGRHNDSKTPNGNYIYGPYLNDFPKNPFNNSITIMDLHDDVDMPESATGDNGWIYKAEGKEIRLDWPGTDSSGNLIYDY